MPKCPTCSDEFETEHGRNVHHYQSHGESIALDETECSNCGSAFEYYPSDKEGIFCSDCVDNSWGNENLVIGSGSDNTNWKGGPVDVKCSWCGEYISVNRWSFNEYRNNFCSKDCEDKWRSKKFSGEGNPRYIDGKHRQRNYGAGWRRARRSALERDDYSCIICGKGKDELGRNPHVHHKKPVRRFDEPKDAHYLDNLVTLCPKHHQKVESGNRKI